jgi:hypothetical protein
MTNSVKRRATGGKKSSGAVTISNVIGTLLLRYSGNGEAISGGAPWSGVIKNRKADGSSYYKRATIVP